MKDMSTCWSGGACSTESMDVESCHCPSNSILHVDWIIRMLNENDDDNDDDDL